MKILFINPFENLAHYRVFIFLKGVAITGKQDFMKAYMGILLSDNFDSYKEGFLNLVKNNFGEMPAGDFYIGWLQKQFVEKYGTQSKEDARTGGGVAIIKDFNYWYHQGIISYGNHTLTGEEDKFFVAGYNAAKSMELNRSQNNQA